MCRVNVMATLEEHSIHVEASNNPDSLLYAAEGDDPGPVARQAWDHFLREDPRCSGSGCAVHLQVQPALPGWRLDQVERGFVWLVHRILHRIVEERKP